MMHPLSSCSIALVAAFGLGACNGQVAPAEYPQQQGYPPGQYAPGQYAPPGYGYPGQTPPPGWGYSQPQQGYGYPPGQLQPQPYPQGYPPSPQGPPPSYPAFPAPNDPINTVDIGYLRATARSVIAELGAALPADAQAKVQGIPFKFDATVGEVNAYAACSDGQALMAITDGLLQTEAYIAQLRATDEVFRTQKLDAYLTAYAREQKPHQPIVAPQPGLVDPAQHVDPRKVARQHQLFEEQVAFVLGHELGHHYLGHTGCANGRATDPLAELLGDGIRILNKVAPVTNQQNEADADKVGIDDVLSAGARRQGYHWTEGGGLLTLYFFSKLQEFKPIDPNFFFRSHPFPALRYGPLRDEASRFRATGVWYRPLVQMP
jgi:hypothetical protein